jgi:hypothetical protein
MVSRLASLALAVLVVLGAAALAPDSGSATTTPVAALVSR